MIYVQITAEFDADELGPHEVYTDSLTLPASFALDAREAHAKLLRLIATEDYFELPDAGPLGIVPLNTETIRAFAVWES